MTVANLRGPHDLTSILGYAWKVYATHFRTLFLLALIVVPVDLLVTILVRRLGDGDGAQLGAAALQIPAALVAIIAGAAIIHAVDEIADARSPEAGHALDTGIQKFLAVFTSQLLVGLVCVAAVFAAPFLALYWLLRRDATIDGRRDWYLALIPGLLAIYLLIRWAFTANSVVLEDRRNWAALDSSAGAVRGYWWRTLGILLVVGMISFAVFAITSASVLASPLVDGLITGFSNALILPLITTAQTLLFYDLKARNRIEPDPAPVAASKPDVQGEGP